MLHSLTTTEITPLSRVNFTHLSKHIWSIILDYSDISAAAALALTDEGESILMHYIADKETLSNMVGIAFLAKMIEFRDFLLTAVNQEVARLNQIEEKRFIKKSTLGRVATGIGLGISSIGPYQIIKKGAERIGIYNALIGSKNFIFEQIKKNCSSALMYLSYAAEECYDEYDYKTGEYTIECVCNYNALFKQCEIRATPCYWPCSYPCAGIVNSINQCNSTLLSQFSSSCFDAQNNENGGWIIFGGAVLSLALVGAAIIPCIASLHLDEKNSDSIKINAEFFQRYSGENEIYQFISTQYILSNTKTHSTTYTKAKGMLNELINELTLEKRHYQEQIMDYKTQLPCMLFKKTKRPEVTITILDDNKDSLSIPLLNIN